MFSRFSIAEIIWFVLALIFGYVFVKIIFIAIPIDFSYEIKNTFFGLNLFLEILVFFASITFVVFGIKGFFENYSRKYANVIIFSTGLILMLVIFILAYQILY
ncbi:hypothetical protein DB895_03780 [Flavobacterium psychrotolerans]|uniref:Uncharacterized protein n=1 Tax=Flavobacterium psychrotolerans TaxID=2169410 RepID=A0A2U1JN04_9FLAO|nr:hypothetical protein DB895_03780 [Flavobacterium psychrotolerans]